MMASVGHLDKRKLTIIAVVIAGSALVFAAKAFNDTDTWSQVIYSLFLGAASSALVSLFTVLLLLYLQGDKRDPVQMALLDFRSAVRDTQSSIKLLEDSKETGLYRLFSASGAFGSHRDWMARLRSARNSIDLLGYSLHVWMRGENFEQEMISLVRDGVHVRILIMDEANPDLPSLINDQQISSVSMPAAKEEIISAKNAFKSIETALLKETPLGSFEFRTLKEGLVVCQICRTDSQMTVVQYLYSVTASRSPLLYVRGLDTELFKVYMAEFNTLWELGTDT